MKKTMKPKTITVWVVVGKDTATCGWYATKAQAIEGKRYLYQNFPEHHRPWSIVKLTGTFSPKKAK